ncbi:MAG: RNA 2',3'-cyclic phosphodiesterase [Actinomycetota bacterium]
MSDHAFLAVDFTDEQRHALSAALSEANPGRRLPGKRPPAENWHITLRFLGEATELQTERLMHRLAEIVDVGPGRVACNGLGAFPKKARAGVLYAAVDDSEGMLARLAMWCEEAAREVGFEPDERPYVPHVTLTRARPAVDVRHTFESWDDFRVPVDVEAITLFRTRRSNNGVRYERIEGIDLV